MFLHLLYSKQQLKKMWNCRFFFIIFIPTCSILKDYSLSKNVLDKNAEENMIPLLQLSNLIFFLLAAFFTQGML